MDDSLDATVAQAADLVALLPASLIDDLTSTLAGGSWPDWTAVRLEALAVTPQPRFRAAIAGLLDNWQQLCPMMSPTALVAMLRTAALVSARCRQQTVNLVWTGPDVPGTHLRRTDQALLEVIESAQSSLLIVSFAVYRVQAIAAALVAAMARDIDLRICLESSEAEGGHVAYDTLRALGSRVAQRAAVYAWPVGRRQRDLEGRTGSLHAKFAVADRDALFVSSANLTQYAMALNMELGILLRGGPAPGQIVEHFDRLIEAGLLVRVR